LALNVQQKQTIVAEMSSSVGTAQAVVMAEYRGLKAGELTELRAKARGAGVTLRVVKNTLARRAFADTPFAVLSDHMVGPLAYGLSTDPVAVAKVMHEFARGNEKFVIKGGAMPNYLMSAKDVGALATMPSREELLAKLLGTMQAPIGKFVQTLNEIPTKFVRALAAVRDAKEKDAPAPAEVPAA